MTDPITLIKESFEKWYNDTHKSQAPVSVVINYKDTQTFAIKAYHTITMDVSIVGIANNLSFISTLFTLKENYNHGTTTEEQAKEGLIKKLLIRLYSYK